MALTIRPLTRDRWADFERLFGPNGACAGCWCLWCRVPGAEFKRLRGDKAKAEMARRVRSGASPGLIAYDGGAPVGWCAVGPREEFRRLLTSRLFKPYFGDEGVWSVPCLFVHKEARGRGVATALLKAAVKRARGRLVEGYPVVASKKTADAFLWWGTLSAFEKAGFKVVARPSKARALVRAG